jgi:acetyl-CoA acetyltransferase
MCSKYRLCFEIVNTVEDPDPSVKPAVTPGVVRPSHPLASAAIAAAHNTEQARRLEGHTSLSITVDAVFGALTAAGLRLEDVDGVLGPNAPDVAYELGIGPAWNGRASGGPSAVLQAASLVAAGVCSVVVIADGRAAVHLDRRSTAPWARPAHEFVEPFGLYTAVEFALIARRHMETFGTTPEQLATVAATIRNNGHANPEAVYAGRGPFTPADVLASPMVADPFHLLDCSTTSEGGCAVVVTTAARAADLALPAVFVLGGGADHFGPSYRHPPSWDLRGRTADVPNGYVGRRAARAAFAAAGLRPSDVDACELYDPFSFEIIRQLEAFDFCADGEGGPFVESGAIESGGSCPITTDGGTMSFSHAGAIVQMLQRVARGVHQLQGIAGGIRLEPEVVLCSSGGAGALFSEVVLIGRNPA